MKKYIISIIILLFIAISCNSKKQEQINRNVKSKEFPKTTYDLAFEKIIDTLDTGINYFPLKSKATIVNFISNKTIYYSEEGLPHISPDGQKLFMRKTINGDDCQVVVDLTTMKEQKAFVVKKNVNNESWFLNVDYIPMLKTWSPDNQYLAFSLNNLRTSTTNIGIVKYDKSYFKLLNFSGEYSDITWSCDGRYLVAGNMDEVYLIDLFKNTCDTINQNKTFGISTGSSSNSKFILSSDNQYLFFEAITPNEHFVNAIPFYANMLYAYNFKTKKLIKLSPSGMYVSDFCLGPNDYIFFTGQLDSRKTFPCIYKTSVTDNKLYKIVSNACNPSSRN